MIKDWARNLHQAKELVRPYAYKDITALDKADLRLLVGYLCGHHELRYYLHKIGLSQETDCRLCLEDDETTTHILCDCPALARLRRLFQQEFLRILWISNPLLLSTF